MTEKYITWGNFSVMRHSKAMISDIMEENQQLKEQIKELETKNKRQCERLKKITDLMAKRYWETLKNMTEDWEQVEKLLQSECGACGDVDD